MPSSHNTTDSPSADELMAAMGRKLKKAATATAQRKMASGEYTEYQGNLIPKGNVPDTSAPPKHVTKSPLKLRVRQAVEAEFRKGFEDGIRKGFVDGIAAVRWQKSLLGSLDSVLAPSKQVQNAAVLQAHVKGGKIHAVVLANGEVLAVNDFRGPKKLHNQSSSEELAGNKLSIAASFKRKPLEKG